MPLAWHIFMNDDAWSQACVQNCIPKWSFYWSATKHTFMTRNPKTLTQAFNCIFHEYLNFANTGLEKSAAIRPFATKKSRLASERILLADSLATESCRLADRMATKFFSKRTTPMWTERDRACARCVAVFVVQDARELAVRAPSIVFASKSTRGASVPSLRFSFRDHLSLVGRKKYHTRCDCHFARHISHHPSST